MGSELGGWAKPSLGQRAGAVAVPVLLTLLLLSPPAAITITSTQDAGAQPAENQLADNQISENHVLIETWTGVVQALAAWQLVEAWTGVILENRPLDNQITENQVADNQVLPENQGADNQVVIEVKFYRRLSGDRVGWHKVPPLSLVNMRITAIVSSRVENAILADYFPSDWTVTYANGGVVSVYDEDYNKIEWSAGVVDYFVSISYVIRSPELTTPPTDYYFRSELTYKGGSATSDEWRVIVADPTDPNTGWKSPFSYANKDAGWIEDEASNSAYSSDDGYAAQTSTNNTGCDYLNFGFNVPSGSIINGIEVSLEGHHSGGSYYPCKFSARLIKNGVEVGNEKIVANNYGHTDSTQTLGGATDLWGATWTYSDINATNFGVRVETDTYFYLPATMYLDHVQVKVYYIPPPGRPILVSPENATQTSDTPTFVWQIGSNADNHRIEVDNDSDFSSPVDNVVFGAMDNTWTKPYPGYLEDNYYWRVWAINACGENCSENAWIFEVITPLPGKPVLYSPADGTMTNDNTPTFEWTVGPNADNHHLLVDASPPDWTGCAIDTTILMSDNTYTPTTGLADDNYSWKVIAVNPKGENVSGVWTFFVDTQAPPAPTLQSPSDGTLTNEPTQTFDWSDVNDQSGVTYEIWIDNDSNFSFPENLENVFVSQYTTTLVDENYSWRVKIYDGTGNENESANWTILIDTQPPIAPTLELPADGAITSDDTPTFDWSDISDAENYDLIVDDDAGFPSPEIQETISVSTYTPTTELADENYFWKVIVRDLVGHENESDVWTFIVDTASFYTYVATYDNVKGTVENFDNQKQEGDGYSMLHEGVSEGEEGEKNISVAQLVCNAGSPDDEDIGWNTWLTNRDFISSVTYLSAIDVTKEQLETYDVVFMCHSVSGEPNVATAVKPANVGVMFVNRRAYNTMKFGTGHNYVSGQTQVTIVDNSHYITSPYPEDNVTYTSSDAESYISGWSGDIQCLGKIPSQATKASILVLDKGKKHIDGSIAPERRVFSGLGYFGPFNMNENGDNLDERALRWVIRAYSLNIYENIEDVPPGDNRYLEILYKLNNIKDNFRVQVWNGTSWENRGKILDSISWEFWSYKLLDNEFTGDDVQIRFIDVENGSVKPNAILKDYLRVRTVLLVAPQWQVVETWTGTVQAPVGWNLIESWTGTVQAPVAWQLIETWTGTVQAPAEWQVIETWIGTVSAPAADAEVTIETSMYDAMNEYSPGPHAVFISDQVGYVFYQYTTVGKSEACYRKTTDGGVTWGAVVGIDDTTQYTFRSFSVWYDRWTPGDDTGTKIHIVAPSSDDDIAHYNYLDTADDSTRGSWVSTLSSPGSHNAPDGGAVVVKSTDGNLFFVWFATGGPQFGKSIDGGETWSDITPTYAFMDDDDDDAQLVPLSGGDILCVHHDTTANTLYWYVYDEGTDTCDASASTLDTKTEVVGYDALFGGSIYRSTGDFYLAANNQPNNAAGDLKAYKFSDSSRSWTTLTNILTDTLAYDVKIAVDQNNGDLYAIYSTNTGVYWKKSTDGGSSWSDATQLSTRAECDIVSHNFMSTERIYGFWYEDASDGLFGDTIADITPSLLPGKPVLVSPENNYQTSDNTPTFTWENGANATYHRLVIDNSSDFSDGDNIYDNANIYDNTCTIENELPPDNYWWHVAAGNGGIENWSENTWRIEIIPYVPPEWQVIETWTGTVEAPLAWKLVETWVCTVEAPAAWQVIETWTGTVEAPLAWKLVETWVCTVEVVGTPSSSIGAISPYWQTSAPYMVTAIASDPDGTVVTVTLWYRYSAKGSDWSAWTRFGADNESPWAWSFTAPENDGYYEFYSVAKDNDNNEELAPAVADVQHGVDRMAPTITSVVINENAVSTSSVDVTISIDASDATSGLAEMRFSLNNVEWSDWETFAANKSYTLPTGDGLKTVYVQVKDKAELLSTVASDSITLETVAPPAPLPPVVVPPFPSPTIPTPPLVPQIFYTLLVIFSVGISGLALYRALTWRIKPFASLKSLKRVVPARPAVNLARLKTLWRIKPAISLKRMMPAPITLAPCLPNGPFKPIPIVTRPPAVGPKRVVPKIMAPSEILKSLKRGPRPSKPGISLKRLKREVFKKKKRRGL